MQAGFAQNPRRGSGGVAGPDRKEPALIPSASGDAFQMGSLKPAAAPVESLTGGEGVGAKASAPKSVLKLVTTSRIGSGCCIYEWRGQQFLGAQAVATAAGRSVRTVHYHLKRHGDLSRLKNDPLGPRSGRAGSPGKPVSVDGDRWPSMKAMADDLCVNIKSVRRWLATADAERLRRGVARARERVSA